MTVSFGLYDAVVLIILLLSGGIAVYRGFLKESLGLASWIIAAFAGLYGYPYVSDILGTVITGKTAADITAGIIIAIAALIICAIITGFATKQIKTSCLNGLDKSLGFLFGLIRGSLIIILLYILGVIVIPFELYSAHKDNFSLPYIKDSLTYADEFLPKDLADSIETRIKNAEELTNKKIKENKTSSIPKPKDTNGTDLIKKGYEAIDRKELTDLIGDLTKDSSATDDAEEDVLPADYEDQDIQQEKEESEASSQKAQSAAKSKPKTNSNAAAKSLAKDKKE